MTPEQLKSSILQYAIQGKLVEQRLEDGNAKELYEEIQKKKKELVKQRKIKKQKIFDQIKEDEIPFNIPQNWVWVRINTIGITQTGNTPKKSNKEYFGTEVPFLGPGDIQNGNVNYKNQGLSNEGKKVARITPKNSILQVCIGGSIGKCALVDREVAFNQQINSIYPIIVNEKYIYYVLNSRYFKSSMKAKAGGTATPIINRGLWDAIIIPLPPLGEQLRIIEKIEKLLSLVNQYTLSWSKLEKLNTKFSDKIQKSILQYAIQGKLVDQRPEEGTAEELYKKIQEEKDKLIREGKIKKQKELAEIICEEIPFDIPENWKWVRLGNLINLQSGQDLKKSEYNDNQIGIPYLTGASNIKDNGDIIINRWTKTPKAFATTGDLLLTCKGTVGKMAFVKQDKVHIARQIMGIRAYCTDLKYIKYFLETQISNLKSMAKSMIPGIERNNVLNLIIPLPPLDEQKRIVTKIEELIPYCEQLIK